eukprot:TRINITY_DN93358_c0_g1_i1.p1 TRINITY_DN93358_c0_g1~~TRINITY_DN93358_c0_g1_i1.p1  ORF type:complete len:613 (+),score=117.59 TRINITY_DN93358_c0_g1_i1:20-1858(+)
MPRYVIQGQRVEADNLENAIKIARGLQRVPSGNGIGLQSSFASPYSASGYGQTLQGAMTPPMSSPVAVPVAPRLQAQADDVKVQRREQLRVISNDTPIKAPKEPTLVENTLLFLPEHAVNELGLEPNMDDKGETRKELWVGRVWELRELLAAQYKRSLPEGRHARAELSASQRMALDAALRDPRHRAILMKLAKTWRGAVVRRRSSLAVIDKLRFSYLRGTVVYAHGSGGCSWDNYRLCRMMARLGMLVIAPDGFAYPQNTAMGQMRHKDLMPLKKASDNVDYWEGDLLYASGADGSYTYSTKADSVLDDPDKYRDLYEKCYQLRRSELHFIMGRLPRWVKNQGFYIAGTSEGAMTVSRFDDQRYGDMVIGRIINSFSIEHCYFTPTEGAARLGGQLNVPTVNIIGTHDEYFGAKDSVALRVKDDKVRGYGDVKLDGHGYDMLMEQELEVGLVCLTEEGMHGPCTTHDNFLRIMFQTFFTRPGSIWNLAGLWSHDPYLKTLVSVMKQRTRGQKLTLLHVPKMEHPQKLTIGQISSLIASKGHDKLTEDKLKEQRLAEEERQRNKARMKAVRLTGNVPKQENYYAQAENEKFWKSKEFLQTKMKRHARASVSM